MTENLFTRHNDQREIIFVEMRREASDQCSIQYVCSFGFLMFIPTIGWIYRLEVFGSLLYNQHSLPSSHEQWKRGNMHRTTKIGRRHFRPVPQNTLHAHLSSAPTTHLSGHSLTIVRFITMGLVILTLAATLPLLPAYLSFLHTVCFTVVCPVGQLTPQAVQAPRSAGLSIHIFVAYTLTLTILALVMCWIVAAVIVWRKSDDWMALLVAVMLVLMGTSYVTHLLLQQPSTEQMLALFLDILTFGVFFLVFCLFPSGQFVPSCLRWMPVGWIIWGLITIALHEVPGFFSIHLVGFIAGLIVIVSTQIYRYFRVSTMVERQQTKWVVWGASVAIVSVVAVSCPTQIT
jgi:hypothetical protein